MIVVSPTSVKFAAGCAAVLLLSAFAAGPLSDEIPANRTRQGDLPPALARQYKRDASRMALRIEAEKEDLHYLSIVIPRDKTNAIFNVLANIWIKSETAKSIARCNVHTFPNPSIDNFTVIYKRAADWAAPLRQGLNETSSPDINRLLTTYNLVIDKHVQWNETLDAITIRSREPLNMTALSREFLQIGGVSSVDMNIPKVAGNDIRILRVQGGWEVEYLLRFGAYSGDPKTHTWRFRALDNGNVSLLSEKGDPIPSWMRCDSDLLGDPLAKRG